MTIFRVLVISFYVFWIGCWIGNFVKLVKQDFEPPYKSEIVHTIGLFGPLAAVTVWFD
jgi:hypothetical protein